MGNSVFDLTLFQNTRFHACLNLKTFLRSQSKKRQTVNHPVLRNAGIRAMPNPSSHSNAVMIIH
jgi:hypothetical protein